MASITIRDLEPQLKERLRVRAAHNGRAMEEEARVILRTTLAGSGLTAQRLGDSIHGRFHALGGVDLAIPEREPMRAPPEPR